ncbi:MAG: hypothetical protein OEY24_04215 [Candidatus Bathyarchaeota archaeon]|nr:hypothetical protein [Candidatus Bathyarchaeota archaeon]MDH5494887.1 hypothetical protein [Candidatus Bathyarchaeota archaeon]
MDEKVGNGIIVGMGIACVLLGFLSWIYANTLFGRLSYVFGFLGIDTSHYIFADLSRIIQTSTGIIVTGLVFLLFGSLGIKKKVKSDTINLGVFIVLGLSLVFLGLINWVGTDLYQVGLMFALMSVSWTKYRAYAKYYVPLILTCGVILIILGISYLYATHGVLIYATGLGVFLGGIACLIFALKGGKKKNENV